RCRLRFAAYAWGSLSILLALPRLGLLMRPTPPPARIRAYRSAHLAAPGNRPHATAPAALRTCYRTRAGTGAADTRNRAPDHRRAMAHPARSSGGDSAGTSVNAP